MNLERIELLTYILLATCYLLLATCDTTRLFEDISHFFPHVLFIQDNVLSKNIRHFIKHRSFAMKLTNQPNATTTTTNEKKDDVNDDVVVTIPIKGVEYFEDVVSDYVAKVVSDEEKQRMQTRRLFIRNMQERKEGQTEQDVWIDTAFQAAELRRQEVEWEEQLYFAWRVASHKNRRKLRQTACERGEKRCLRPVVAKIMRRYEYELEEHENRTGLWFY